jgi:hypothetical protein
METPRTTVETWLDEKRKHARFVQPPDSRQHFDVWNFATDVEAYGRGEIELEAIPEDTNKSYIHAFPPGKAYTLDTIAPALARGSTCFTGR